MNKAQIFSITSLIAISLGTSACQPSIRGDMPISNEGSSFRLSISAFSGFMKYSDPWNDSHMRSFGAVAETTLSDGRILVVNGGGWSPLKSEFYDPTTQKWTSAGSLSTNARGSSTLSPLSNGKALIVGGQASGSATHASAELFDPASNTWSTAPNSMASPRLCHTATVLQNGKVLVVGGQDYPHVGMLSSVELYDPASQTWSTKASLGTARACHSASLLSNGKVLVLGGLDANYDWLTSAELYDPEQDSWSTVGDLLTARASHKVATLNDGRILILGGASGNTSAEIYDPSDNSSISAGTLPANHGSVQFAMTRLANGQVLVSGGFVGFSPVTNADLYTPVSGGPGSWAPTGALNLPRMYHRLATLPSGKVLSFAGSTSYTGPEDSVEVYNPATASWSITLPKVKGRYLHSMSLLPSGKVLIAGGQGFNGSETSAEIYDPNMDTFTPTGSMQGGFVEHHAVVLPVSSTYPQGAVLILQDYYWNLDTEIYNVATGTFSAAASVPHVDWSGAYTVHTLTHGPNAGKVLLIGGEDGSGTGDNFVESTYLYDPATDSWTATGSLARGRAYHTSALLADGSVLVVGGFYDIDNWHYDYTAEIYNPVTGTWRSAGSNLVWRGVPGNWHPGGSLTALKDGSALYAGGVDDSYNQLKSAERYTPDPLGVGTGTWSATPGDLSFERYLHTANLLPSGRVLIAGGSGTGGNQTAELFDPVAGTFSPTASLNWGRAEHPSVTLLDGSVMFHGGPVSANVEFYYTYAPISLPSIFGAGPHLFEILSGGGVVYPARSVYVPDQAFAGAQVRARSVSHSSSATLTIDLE